MASGSGWNLWVWLVVVVIRRYINFLILLIYPYSSCICSFFAAASLHKKMFFVLVPILFKIIFLHSINTHLATTGVPRQPYEGCTYCFIHEEAHTNIRFISSDGHQLFERGVDRNRGRALYRDASRAGRLRTAPASFKGQRSRTRRRSQCMPRRVRAYTFTSPETPIYVRSIE